VLSIVEHRRTQQPYSGASAKSGVIIFNTHVRLLFWHYGGALKSFASWLYQGCTASGDCVVVTEKFAEDSKLEFDVGNSKGRAVPIQTY
jgi:hypothetical protein